MSFLGMDERWCHRSLHNGTLATSICRTFIWRVFPFASFLPGNNQENKYGKPPNPGIDIKRLFGF
jgi:hypothetical protein